MYPISVSNMNTLGQKTKEEFELRAIDRFEVYVTLTFDPKVIVGSLNPLL